MANLISAKVYQIDGSPQTSAITLDFPTSNILIADCSVSTISEVNSSIQYYPNPKNLLFFQTFYVSEEIADLVAAANVGGTTQSQVGVFEINSDPFQTLSAADGGTGVQYSFPSNNISVWPSVNSTTGINSFILFKGDKYYTDSTVAEVKTTSNSGDYKVYTALLTQTGTDAPVATVLQNTLGGEVVWTRNDVGNYTGTLAGAFVSGKTFCPTGLILSSGDGAFFKSFRNNDDTIGLYTYDTSFTFADASTEVTSPISFEIRVYP